MALKWCTFQILTIVQVLAMKRNRQDLTRGPLLSGIITYTVPIILTSVLQLLFNAADLVVVGRFRGSLAVGAVGATGSITRLLINFFIGLSIGAGVSVAHAIGAKQEQKLHRIIHTAVFVALAGGVLLTVVGVSCANGFLRAMDTPAEILPLSTTYMQIYFCGITFNLVYNFCAAILRAAGDTKSPLTFLTIAGVLNVIFNLIFVVVCGMSVAGVALATVISQGVSAVLVVRALTHRTDGCRLNLLQIRPHKAQFLRILRIGVPAGIQSSLFAASNVIIQSSINSFGDVVVAGSAAAANLGGFADAVVNSFCQTSTNYTGQNVGAGNHQRVRKIFWTCCLCAALAGIVIGGGLYLGRETLLSLYITDSPEAMAYGALRVTYIYLPYFLGGLMQVTTGALRGLGSSLTPMLMSVLGVCGIRLVWIFTVFRDPRFHSLETLFISYPISWLFTFVVELIAFFIVYRRWVNRTRTQTLST